MAFVVAADGLPSSFVDPESKFQPELLEMTAVGWSLSLPCQVTAPEGPVGYCRLPVGHGGSHEGLIADDIVHWCWGNPA